MTKLLLALFFAVKAWSYGLDRYLLLYGDNGVVVGAGHQHVCDLDAGIVQDVLRVVAMNEALVGFDHCARIVSEIEDAESAVTSLQNTPRGPLRVTAGPNAAWLGPILSDYLKR